MQPPALSKYEGLQRGTLVISKIQGVLAVGESSFFVQNHGDFFTGTLTKADRAFQTSSPSLSGGKF